MRAQRSTQHHTRRRWSGLPRAAEHRCPHRPSRRDPRGDRGRQRHHRRGPRRRQPPRRRRPDLRRPAAHDPRPASAAPRPPATRCAPATRSGRSRRATARRWRPWCTPTGSRTRTSSGSARCSRSRRARRHASVKAPAGGATTHVVQAGDTLGGIASRYGITVAQIVAANGITGDRIYVGQQLRLVPVGRHRPPTSATTYIVRVRRHAVEHRPEVRHHGRAPSRTPTASQRRPRHDRSHAEDPGGRHRRRRQPSAARCRAAPAS